MSDKDEEATSAHMSGFRAILYGPWFPIRLHMTAFRYAKRQQIRWIRIELMATLVWVVSVFAWLPWAALRYHVIVMSVGQCLTAFFAVWTVHHDCERFYRFARTIRGKLKTLSTFEMFYHLEHHLFPRVPTRRWHVLAARIEQVAPELRDMVVF